MFKASEFSPATARVIVECLVEAGLPDGVVNLIFGNPAAISEQLLASSVVKAVTFTGSTLVGKHLARLAAPNLIRSVFELGGHAPVIIWEDANIDHVIATTSPAKFGSAGQSCVAPGRYLVHKNLYEKFTQALVARAESYQIGHGNEEGTTLGAVAHQGRVDALIRLTDVGRPARSMTRASTSSRRSYPMFLRMRTSSPKSHSDLLQPYSLSLTLTRRSGLPTRHRILSPRICLPTRSPSATVWFVG